MFSLFKNFFKRNEDTPYGAPLVWLHKSGYLNIVFPLDGYAEFSSDYIKIKRWNKLVISSIQQDVTVSFWN